MKVLGSALILVIAVHAQCLVACPVELYRAPLAEPPCHDDSSDSSDDSGAHEAKACGFGVVVEFKSAPNLKCVLDGFSFPPFATPTVESISYSETAAMRLMVYSLKSSSPPISQNPVLRI